MFVSWKKDYQQLAELRRRLEQMRKVALIRNLMEQQILRQDDLHRFSNRRKKWTTTDRSSDAQRIEVKNTF